MIEFALVFTFLFPMFAGVFELGFAFFQYNRLVSGVRAGARYASLETYSAPGNTPPDSFLAAVKNTVIYGNPAGGTTPITPGLTPANVALSVIFEDNIPARIGVKITNYRLDCLLGLYTLNTPAATFPYTGRFAPL
jgi:Flp pilus assembly protein TadG